MSKDNEMMDLAAAVAALNPRLKVSKVEVVPPQPKHTKLIFVDKEAAHVQVGVIGYVIEGNEKKSAKEIAEALSKQLERNDAAVKAGLEKKLKGEQAGK